MLLTLCIRRHNVLLTRCVTDGLVKKLNELEKTADMYKGLMEHTKRLLKCFFDLSQSHRGEAQ